MAWPPQWAPALAEAPAGNAAAPARPGASSASPSLAEEMAAEGGAHRRRLSDVIAQRLQPEQRHRSRPAARRRRSHQRPKPAAPGGARETGGWDRPCAPARHRRGPAHWRRECGGACAVRRAAPAGRRSAASAKGSSPVLSSSMPIEAELRSLMPPHQDSPACQARADSSTSCSDRAVAADQVVGADAARADRSGSPAPCPRCRCWSGAG
jgi:hypothetical protein